MMQGLRFLASAQLTAAAASIYAPTLRFNQQSRIGVLLVCNTDTVRRTFTLHRVLSGGSVAASNAMWYGCPIEAGQTLPFCAETLFTLANGDALHGLADVTSKVNVFIFGDG